MQLNPGFLCTDSLAAIKEVFRKMTDSYSTKMGETKEKEIVEKEIETARELIKAEKFETKLYEGHIDEHNNARGLQDTNESTPTGSR